MYYIITYDIPNDLRRNKIAKILLDFGKRVQYSVFEAELTDKLYEKMLERLRKYVEETEDNLIIYQLCRECLTKRGQLGCGKVEKDKDVYII